MLGAVRAVVTPSGGVHVRPPRSGGLLRPRARDWGGHEARLGSHVGRVGRYDRAAARTCEWDRAVARYLAFNSRRSGAWLASVVLMSHRRTNTDRGHFFIFQRLPAYRTIRLASCGGECEFLVSCEMTRNACEQFPFNRRQLLCVFRLRCCCLACAVPAAGARPPRRAALALLPLVPRTRTRPPLAI